MFKKLKLFARGPKISSEQVVTIHSKVKPDVLEPQISVVSHTGQQLAQARKKLKLSVTDVAASLSLSESVIEAIEAREYDQLYGKAYATGYVRAYASLVKLDADELIARDSYLGVVMVDEDKLKHPPGSIVYRTGDTSSRNWVSLSIKSLIVFVVIALIIFGWHNRETISRFWHEQIINDNDTQNNSGTSPSAIPSPGESNSDTSST